MIKKLLYNQLRKFIFPNKGITHIKRPVKLIVSLTSHPGRINVVEKTIDSILRQSLKPDMVILWLADTQFPEKEKSLPKSLCRYLKHGLQIRWCEDIRSYKKLIPALREFPDDIIVTADDDIVFWEDWLKSLYVSYWVSPDCIQGYHAYHYHFDSDNNLQQITINDQHGILKGTTVFGSGAGILFPPHTLCDDVCNEDFMSIAPTNDDLWWWAMAHLKRTPLQLIENCNSNIVCIENTQQDGLCKSENSEGEVSRQFQNIIAHYPELQQMINHKMEDVTK